MIGASKSGGSCPGREAEAARGAKESALIAVIAPSRPHSKIGRVCRSNLDLRAPAQTVGP
jgi:hypothetical protein